MWLYCALHGHRGRIAEKKRGKKGPWRYLKRGSVVVNGAHMVLKERHTYARVMPLNGVARVDWESRRKSTFTFLSVSHCNGGRSFSFVSNRKRSAAGRPIAQKDGRVGWVGIGTMGLRGKGEVSDVRLLSIAVLNGSV